MRKIYVVGFGKEYANWMEGEVVFSMKDADLVVFTGGEDVSPAIYHRKAHPLTYSNLQRDGAEVVQFQEAKRQGKHIIGICRGSQFLCAMAGGVLIQDQDNPTLYHDIETYDGKKIVMTSTHHQAQCPWQMKESDYKVLAWTKGISKHHDGPSVGVELVYPATPCSNREVEIAYYPLIKALAIQGHPEMMYRKAGFSKDVAESIAYCRDLLNKHMEDKL